MTEEIDLSKIIQLRKHLGITQEKAAEAVGLSRTVYVGRENRGNFSKEEMEKLAVLFEVKPDELYKKSQVYVAEGINRLMEVAIRTEALHKAVLVGIVKMLSFQTGMDATKILEDLTSVANLQSSSFVDELKRMSP
jgi:DNA-binding XRE family transcriptional regulator